MCLPHPETSFHLPPHPIPLGCLRALTLDALLHASSSHWSSILQMVMNMLQLYSLKSSHSFYHWVQKPVLYVSILCYSAYRIITTVFLNSIYMCYYTVFVFLFLTYFTLYNRLEAHHLIRTDLDVFLFMAESYFIVYMYHNFLILTSLSTSYLTTLSTSRLRLCPSYCE